MVQVAPADTTDALRLSFAPTLVQAGTYRLFARMKASGVDTQYAVRAAGDSVIRPKTVTVLGTTRQWIDLGVFGFPTRNGPTSAPYTLGAGDVEVWAASATTGNLELDSFVLVPLNVFEGKSRVLTLPSVASGRVVTVDAESDTVSLTSDGVLVAGATTSPTGVFLRASPGVENVLHFFSRMSLLPSSQTLELSYHPRYLWVP